MPLHQRLLILIFFISTYTFGQNDAKVYGVLKNDKNKPVKGVMIIVEGLSESVYSDKKGNYTITNFPTGKSTKISFLHESHLNKILEVSVNDGEIKELNVELKERELQEVIVESNTEKEIRQQVSMVKIDPKQIENLPSVFGDFNKVLVTLGASSSNELSSTYSVRGGNYNENLVYVNGIPIYRPFIVSSGKQEGLSFVNPNMVSSVEFSAGGWQPKYGDKLSSVLAVEYKTPSKFAGSVSASALGGGFHLEGSDKENRLTFVSGMRYKDSRWVLRNTDDGGAEFKPWFIDFQSYLNYDLTNRDKYPDEVKTTIGLLTSYAKNNFYFQPTTKETDFGNFSVAKRITIGFDGDETMSYEMYQNGLKLDHKFTSNLRANFILSNLYTIEREFFDIEGGMRLCDVSLDPNSEGFNKCSFTQDIGSEYRYGRNQLEAQVYNLQSNWDYAFSEKSVVEWGAIYSNENIVDVIDEYSFIDSADYVNKLQNLDSDLNLRSSRVGAFAQHSITIDSNKVFTYGVRSSFWDVNKQVTVSPRTQFSVKPKWKRDYLFKTAAGIYHQPPFYRELRNNLGVLNKNLKAQMSAHLIAGMDHNYKMWGRDFKMTTELYYKYINNVVVYDLDDVKIRYRANNDASAYAYGADFRISGEFIKGAESWFSLGLMRTREKLNNDKFIGLDSVERSAGFVPRPTDQLVMLGMFFQDHIPSRPTWRMYLNGVFGSGLPFSIPGAVKQTGYTYTADVFNADSGAYVPTELSARTMSRMVAYRRVDIGISKIIAFNVDEEVQSKGIRSIWIGLEVLNALASNNMISYTWVNDLYGTQYAIPNYLSRRMINLKMKVKF